MSSIVCEPPVCQQLETALTREWLDTNGLGGYASSTIISANTRRTHGLLVAALEAPRNRYCLCASLDETLVVRGTAYGISTHLYEHSAELRAVPADQAASGRPTNRHSAELRAVPADQAASGRPTNRIEVTPHGYQHLIRFQLAPFPMWTYRIDDVLILKSFFLVHGEHTAVVSYRLVAGEERDVRLDVRPLIAYRPHDGLTRKNLRLNPTVTTTKGVVEVQPYPELPPLFVYHEAAILDKAGRWYTRLLYPRDAACGAKAREDLFSPCTLTYSFVKSEDVFLTISTKQRARLDARRLEQEEHARRMRLAEDVRPAQRGATRSTGRPSSELPPDQPVRKTVVWLERAADAFLVKRGRRGAAIVAGYPTLAERARDTLVALPGLTLETGQLALAKQILLAYTHDVHQGLLPAQFPERPGTAPDYASVDAPLWFVQAAYLYYEATDDVEAIDKEFYPLFTKMVKWLRRGTQYGIHITGDGLLTTGDPRRALTWMDAYVEGKPVTSRTGQPVEVAALWYNALKILATFAKALGRTAEEEQWEVQASAVYTSFQKLFWNAKKECLYDCIGPDGPNEQIRPNQLFAVSLPFPVLAKARWKSVVKIVENTLVTPYGVRTLAPREVGRRPQRPADGESTKHEGGVWPWLVGPFARAYVKTFGNHRLIRARLERYFAPLLVYLEEEGVGTIPEYFDGHPPHVPCGAPAHAMGTAELLRFTRLLKPEKQRPSLARHIVLK